MFALVMGAGAKPLQKNGVILRRVRRPLGTEGSRAAPIYKGGAEPVRRSMMSITVIFRANEYDIVIYRQNMMPFVLCNLKNIKILKIRNPKCHKT